MPTKNAVAVWDFTISKELNNEISIKNWLNETCKKWAFQLEEGESGYIHYQGRVSLKVKVRLPEGLTGAHWTPTSSESSDNDFYATKEKTRIEGPWTNKDVTLYIPRQIREIDELFPWQKDVIEMAKTWDKRSINCLIDTKGNIGKSILKTYMGVYKISQTLPFCNDFKDVMRMAYDMPESTCYMMDMPRAVNKDRLYGLFGGLENLKDGYCYDDRYAFRQKYMDCPNIWVFSNTIPDTSLMSKDRWKFWGVDSDKRLFKREVESEKGEFFGAML